MVRIPPFRQDKPPIKSIVWGFSFVCLLASRLIRTLAPSCQKPRRLRICASVDRRAPALVPSGVSQFFTIATVAFGGTALRQAEGGLRCQAVLFGRQLTLLDGRLSFLKQKGCHGCGATLVADRRHVQAADEATARRATTVSASDPSSRK